MDISSEELYENGFERRGTVHPDAATTLRVEIDETKDIHGFVVYLMIVNHEVMKAGKTETPFSRRMRSTFNSLKNKMGDRADHPRYQEKTFKEHAQATIRAGLEIELWAKSCPSIEMMYAEEDRLNQKYQGLWTKEGKHRARGHD